jgi:hypothetical protein
MMVAAFLAHPADRMSGKRNPPSDKYWGEGRAVYRRPDVPANSAPDEGIIIDSDEDHKRISAAVHKLYGEARGRRGRVPSWLRESDEANDE